MSHGRRGKKWSEVSQFISCRNPSCAKRFGIENDEDGENVLKKHCRYFAMCFDYCFGDVETVYNSEVREDTEIEESEEIRVSSSVDGIDVGNDEVENEIVLDNFPASSEVPASREVHIVHHDILEIQKAFEDVSITKQSLKMRSKGREDSDMEVEDLFKIYQFGFNVGVSSKQGDELLVLINDLLKRYDAKTQTPVTTWDAIRNMVRRGTKQFDVKIPFSMDLPERYFGKYDPQKPDVKLDSVTGHFFNVKFKLAKYFLQIKPEQVVSKRIVRMSADGDTLLEGFSTGDVFKKFSDHDIFISDPWGDFEDVGDAIHVMLNISFDKAQASMNNSMGLFPVSFNVLNVLGDESFFQLIGYCPMNLPYDDVTLIR
jgi:hypothetical protein